MTSAEAATPATSATCRSSNLPNNDFGPYSIHNNWRVPGELPNAPTTPPKPINRNWLQELLLKHPNPSTPSDLRTKALVVAPMVDQSDLPFRLQCRKYGSNLCFTPMIHSRLFQENEKYRAKFICDHLPNTDRPVIAQLCGPDPHTLLQTALAVAPFVDGIDLNCGCPQGIAKRGLYGAFLLEEPELLLSIVHTLVHNLTIPVSVKVRLLPAASSNDTDTTNDGNNNNNNSASCCDLDASISLYTKLVDAGISLLTVHGRTRLQTKAQTGAADWDSIRRVVQELGHLVPILANGGIASLRDVRACLQYTGADGVLSSEAILEYPALFVDEEFPIRRSFPGRLELATEYLELARQYPPECGGQGSGFKTIRGHVHKLIHADLQLYPEFRAVCVEAEEVGQLEACLAALAELHATHGHVVQDEKLHWYRRHQDREIPVLSQGVKYVEIAEDTGDCLGGLFGLEDDDDDEEDE